MEHYDTYDCDGGYYSVDVIIGTNVVTIQPAYDEEVLATAAYDETVIDQAAYDEVITKGYRCAECGATKCILRSQTADFTQPNGPIPLMNGRK